MISTRTGHSRNFRATCNARGARKGIAAIWVILAVPVVLVVLILVTDIAHLRLARIEAENALEAAALAAVKQWRDGGNTAANRTAARQACLSFAAANTVVGHPVALDANENQSSGDANDNASITGNVVLGAVAHTGGGWQLKPATAPGRGKPFGVHVQATVPVNSLWGQFGGLTFGPYSVSAQATAYFPEDGEPELIRINGIAP